MNSCLNCNHIVKENDKYCRNCGIEIKNGGHYVAISVFTFLAILGLILLVILFVASYLNY